MPRSRVDVLRIASGALGPVPECALQIKPLTVFIGGQGTGKSLVAQLLYFFEELPYLAWTAREAETEDEEWTSALVVRYLLDRLRSSERAFGTFANPNVVIEYERAQPYSKTFPFKNLGFSAHRANRVIRPRASLKRFVDRARSARIPPLRRAVFFPTERLVISQLRTALSDIKLSLPLTYSLFSEWMELAASTMAQSSAGANPAAEWVKARGLEALGGSAVRRGRRWLWVYGSKAGQQLDMDLASSGQRSNWSLPYLAQALFRMDKAARLTGKVTIFVEEPEIHLHPGAQVAMAKILAFLVHHGYRVVVTTHSLTVLYALNNFVQASRISDGQAGNLPPADVRIAPGDLAAYAFAPNVAPRAIVDDETGFIDETELGHVAEELAAEMSRIAITLAREKSG